ncbi:LamG domain-containing protein [Portibacter lacus]|uniref:IPTL-CTERM protein sorting domain-containing protein n=1 Tax=Portibacter lacus TaxID=1099794 RepID=A0AA37SPH4_9BACT|nr:LamG domain-containing protein [Portibacter lacus]GLR16779.1 hypothetical protein GCM10007940_13940 [Portibacter lacus]
MKSFSIFILFNFLLFFFPTISLAQDAYDVCSGAVFLEVDTDCNSEIFSFSGNTGDPDECDDVGVWFAVVIPASGSIHFSTTNIGTNDDTEIKVFQGTCDNLILMSEDCQDDDNSGYENHEEIEFSGLLSGDTLYFLVDDRGESGTFGVCTYDPASIQIPSDICATATPLNVGASCELQIFTFDGSTGNGEGESDECADRGVWFQAIVPENGIIIFTTSAPGNITDTEIKAFSGTCDDLVLLSDDCQDEDNTEHDNHERIFLSGLTPGETIYFVVDDRGGIENDPDFEFEIGEANFRPIGAETTFSACAFSPAPCDAEPNKFSVNFDNTLEDLCRNGSFDVVGSTGTYNSEALLMDETVYCFGNEDGLSYSTDALDICNEYSIELYFKFDQYSGYQRIIDFSNGSLDEGLYTDEDELTFYDYSETNPAVFTSTSEYYHVVLTYSNYEFVLYVNGVLYETISDDENIGFNPASFIFFKDDGDEDESGCVRMLNIYNYAVTPAMVSEMALAPTAEDCPLIASAIPTMSQWGIILLSLLMLIFGIVSLKQKRIAFSE